LLRRYNPISSSHAGDAVDSCIFMGHLRDESSVPVAVTGGCPFSYNFEVLQGLK
jgi:hypothetical protein